MPYILGAFRQRDAFHLAAALAVEQAQLDLLGICRKQREIGAAPVPGCPSGCGAPDESRTLGLRDEKNCGQGRNNKADLGNRALVQRPDPTAVPDIAAAVDVRNRC